LVEVLVHVAIRARLLLTLREGREIGAPFCCRLRYAIAELLNPDAEQCVKRGVRFGTDRIEYVPCGLLHKAAVTHREHEHTLNLREFTRS